MKRGLILLTIFLSFIIFMPIAYAHGGEETEGEIERDIHGFASDFLPAPLIIGISILSLFPFLILVLIRKNKKNISRQHIIFWIIVYLVSTLTLIIIADTINLTIKSETNGPVHWHADFEIWNCGEKLDIIDPDGLANRVGSRMFHEHGDGRMHVEGIIGDKGEVDLHNFFRVIGGDLSETSFNVLTNNGIIEANNGEVCNGEAGEVQIFLYKVTNAHAGQKSGFLAEQVKVNGDYVLSPYQDVPPGDCIIVEFDKRKDKTEKICNTYKLAVEQGRMVVV